MNFVRNFFWKCPTITFVVLAFSLSTAFCQELVFDHLSVRQGLSQANIWDITQTKLGFIWIATEDGLNMYDGYSFTVFRNNPDDSSTISNSNIHCIKEDVAGNLWIGTRLGLNYYSKSTNSFTRYLHDPKNSNTVSNNDVTSVFLDSNSNLWVGTAKGLNRLAADKKTFTQFFNDPKDNNSLIHNRITAINGDSRHRIWIGTTRGLSLLNADGTFTDFSKEKNFPPALRTSQITSILQDRDGVIWIGTFINGLFKLDTNGVCTNYQYDRGDQGSIGGNYIYTLTEDPLGNIWVASDGSLSCLKKGAKTFTRYTQNQDDESSLTSNIVTEVFFDKNDRMWVGTRFGGVNIYDPGKYPFKHFKYSNRDQGSLSNNTVTSFQEEKNGDFWVATDGGSLNYYHRKENKFTNYLNTFTNNKILAVTNDKRGGVWVGMWNGGLNYFDPVTKKVKRYKNDPKDPKSLSDNNIFFILRDSHDNIWIATWGNGLNKYNPVTDDFTRYVHDANNPNSIGNFAIDYLMEDSNGKIWIALENDGVDRFDPATNTFTHYGSSAKAGGLSSNSVFSLCEDSKKRIWVGTNAGLNLFDPKTETFTAYRQKDGLPNEGIMGIQEEPSGRLWISTNKGLSRFDPDKRSFKNFLERDGLQGDQFNRWASRRLSSGELLFGGTNGFNLFHPDSIKENTFKPPVYITDFKIFNKPVGIGPEEVLKENIVLAKEIHLSYLHQIISFEFTALNYRQPEKNQYRYKMEGFQDYWVEAGYERKASYTNLSPGKYTFHVIASNNDGVWNEKGASIKIIIAPPYWQTWWFKVLIGVFCIGLIYLLFIIRMASAKKQKMHLEAQITEKTLELQHQKDAVEAQAENMQALHEQQQAQTEYLQSLNEQLQLQKEEVVARQEEAEKARTEAEQANQAKSIFLATMSHEIRTPMNGVLGMAALLGETSLTTEQQEYTDTIRSSGEALLTVINDILDFSKIESGNLELDNHSFDLRQCIEEVMDVFSAKASQKGLDLVYQIDYQIPAQIVGDGHRLRQILLNLISNAMKFTHQGEIFVSVNLLKSIDGKLDLAFHVKDSGIGIPKDKLSRLFKAFSQVDSSTTRKYGGTGLGLVISERLVQLMDGSISVESESGVGTTFTFTIKSGVSQESLRQYVHFNTAGNEGKKVLVIDDNATNLTILKGQLERWTLSPTLASSGKEALEILSQSQQRFDLVIADMQMPDMDGLQLSQRIKTLYNLPIILLSSVGDESKRKHPELFSAVLNKPVKQQQLSRVVQAALRPDATVSIVDEPNKKQLLTDEFATMYPLKILLAEDNIVNQKLTTRVLSKLGYKNVEIAQNGLEAIEKFDEEFYEVILMDVQMPEMDGLEATRLIRMKQYHQPVIISMTANAMQDDKDKCIQAGMNEYISKPIDLEELVGALIRASESFKPKRTEEV
jgi:signal transduction histidine kinase/ligand-binding sensor domain-containing protein/DNA-binding response OmpR family regulator